MIGADADFGRPKRGRKPWGFRQKTQNLDKSILFAFESYLPNQKKGSQGRDEIQLFKRFAKISARSLSLTAFETPAFQLTESWQRD